MANYQLRIRYSTIISGLALNHTQKTWVKMSSDYPVDTAWGLMDVTRKSGVTTALSTYVSNDYLGLVRQLFNTTTNFSTAELWRYEDTSDTVGEFVQAAPIGLAGLSANPTVVANQAMIICKGGSPSRQARFNFMETVINSNLYDPYPIANVAVNNLAVYLIGSSSAHVNLVGNYLGHAISGSYGEHEDLFKKRFRA